MPSRRSFLARTAAAGALLPLAGLAGVARGAAPPAKRPVCIFSKHLQWLDYDALGETAAEIGFDGVDLSVRPGGHVLPERVEEDLPRAVEAVRRAGLAVPMMTTAITDPRDPLTEPVLRTASRLGIGAYRTGYVSYRNDRSLPETIEALRPQFRDLAEMNRQYGLHGAYQNHAGTRLGGPVWDLHLLLQGLDPRWMGVQYDVRHAVVEGGEAWPLGLRLLHPYVRTLVAKDFHWAEEGGRWKIRDVPLGQGMVDFPRYLKLVRELGIEGPISLHLEYPLPHDRDPNATRSALLRDTVAVMRRDVATLRGWLAEADL